MPKVIEFLGNPASGKSTIAEGLRKALPFPSLSRKEAENLIAQKIGCFHRFFLYIRIFFLKDFRPYWFTSPRIRQAAYWLQRDVFIYESLSSDWPPLLLDEGYQQHLATFAFISGHSIRVAQMTWKLGDSLASAVIHLEDVDEAAGAKRMLTRGVPSSWGEASDTEQVARYYRFAAHIKTLIQQLAATPNQILINKKTVEDFSSTVSILSNVLQTYFANGDSATKQ